MCGEALHPGIELEFAAALRARFRHQPIEERAAVA